MKNIEQSHIALLIRMATEAVADAARVQWQQGTAGRWWGAGQPLQVGRGRGMRGVKILLMSYHYVVS